MNISATTRCLTWAKALAGLAGLCCLVALAPLRAADPLPPIDVGVPTRIEVLPTEISLADSRAEAQLVVTGHYADGSVRDLTRAAVFTSLPAESLQIAEGAGAAEAGLVRPKVDGVSEVLIQVGGQEARVKVTTANQATSRPVSFLHEVLPVLTKQGCNMGACHGSPSGKGGFRLSLRAFDSEVDKLTLIREDLGRRTNPLDPEQSLLLAKPLMKVPHGGGQKLHKGETAYNLLRDWIAEGCQSQTAVPQTVIRIAVSPPTGRTLLLPAREQQLSVQAYFADGTSRDVTRLACYSSSDTEVAEVSEEGRVTGLRRGEAAIVVRFLEFIESNTLTFIEAVPNFAWTSPSPANYVDEHVYAKLQKLSYLPSGAAADEEFLRRVYYDVIGLLPTPAETRLFLADAAPNKRAVLIDQLLERPEYARFWALKGGDLLKMSKSQIGPEGVFKYHQWVQRGLAANMPYDQFARELLGAKGSTLENAPANFYRTTTDTNDCVETVSQVFLGSRLQCAKCHNHPFERWTQDNYYGMAAFFTRVQRKKLSRPDDFLIYSAKSGEVTQPRTGKTMKPWLPLVGEIDPAGEADRREAFVNWLVAKENPFFAKVAVNRMWGQLFGRGIVDPVDDFRDSNPPSNKELLDALAKDFANNGYNRKAILRTMLNSKTYQADFRANEFNKADLKYFSHYQPRLLGAEQLLDAIGSVTDLPEKFAGLPDEMRATQIPAPDLVKSEFLKVFGQPERQTVCQCERASDSNLAMAIQFFNGPVIFGKLRDANNRFRKLVAAGKTDPEILSDLYLAAVCREPTPAEVDASIKHLASKPDRAAALEDICWALLNTNEFLFQH